MATWTDGDKLTVTFVLVDPLGSIAYVFDESIREEEYAFERSLLLDTPMWPGLWTIRILYQWSIVAENNFLVLPLSFYKGVPISSEQAAVLNHGVEVGYETRAGLNTLSEDEREKMRRAAENNSLRSGKSLSTFVDGLLSEMWRVNDHCKVTKTACPFLTECAKKNWSTKYPDVKATISGINKDTGKMVS